MRESFKDDCLKWMLFNGSNLTASADGLEWNGRKWSIVNHFIPFTEDKVDAPERFESDFMVRYIAGRGERHARPQSGNRETRVASGLRSRGVHDPAGPLPFSTESCAVLDAGREIWRTYFRRFGELMIDLKEHARRKFAFAGNRFAGSAGGAKDWLKANCPLLAAHYSTCQRYKRLAQEDSATHVNG